MARFLQLLALGRQLTDVIGSSVDDGMGKGDEIDEHSLDESSQHHEQGTRRACYYILGIRLTRFRIDLRLMTPGVPGGMPPKQLPTEQP